MKKVGIVLIYIGTVASLTAAARIPPHYQYFWISLGILCTGILIKILSTRPGTRVTHAVSIEDMRDHLLNTFREIQSLRASREIISITELHERIDHISNEFLYAFGSNASNLKAIFGTAGYNSVMSHYALGERYINRVWSASADGYAEESFDYLEKAEPEFRETLGTIDKLFDKQKI